MKIKVILIDMLIYKNESNFNRYVNIWKYTMICESKYMVKYDSEYCYAYDMKAFICKYMKGNNFMICNLGNIYICWWGFMQ